MKRRRASVLKQNGGVPIKRSNRRGNNYEFSENDNLVNKMIVSTHWKDEGIEEQNVESNEETDEIIITQHHVVDPKRKHIGPKVYVSYNLDTNHVLIWVLRGSGWGIIKAVPTNPNSNFASEHISFYLKQEVDTEKLLSARNRLQREGWIAAPCDYDEKLYCVKKHLAFKAKVPQKIAEAKHRVGHCLGVRFEIDLKPVQRNNFGTMVYSETSESE
eukprot:TRINITY_DN8347_c0_g1_i1.p1 TRINITY_DN8347_c0_g1~~TRINITY_DN8347_c0_g1_i1.p1  ORF type:complete len:216 (-),score=37.77 TRINITY_DN8347_c0_g1_i1:160-807(-)